MIATSRSIADQLPRFAAADVDSEQRLQLAAYLVADEGDGLAIWRDLRVLVALIMERVRRQPHAGGIGAIVADQEDAVPSLACVAPVDEVVPVGGKRRLAARRRHLVKIAAVGVHQVDGLVLDPEHNPGAVG